MLRIRNRVSILSSRKTDGRCNSGIVTGIELVQNGYYLGYKNREEFYKRFTVPRYKVAFIDCVTERTGSEWFGEPELRKEVK